MPLLANPAARDPHGVRFRTCPWPDDDPRRRDLEQRLAPDHLARRIDQAVDRLDLSVLHGAQHGTGSDPYPPALLLKVVLYHTQRGQHSPASWYRDAAECEPVRWLLRGLSPSRSCWYAFRDRLAPWLQGLNGQPLAQALAAGLTPAARASLDGTTVAANASRHRLVNEPTLARRWAQLQEAIAADERAAAAACPPGVAAPDAAGREAPATVPAAAPPAAAASRPPAAAPDATGTVAPATVSAAAPPAACPATPAPDPAARPGWLAETPAGRQRQRRRLQRARERLAELQARNRQKRRCKRKDAAAIVISPGDSEAVVGRDKEWISRPLSNVQIVDDLDSPFLLAYEVFAQQNDAGTLATMLARLRAGLGRVVPALLADPAYAGGPDLAVASAAGVTLQAPVPGDPVRKTGAKAPKEPKPIPKREFRWLEAEPTYVCPQGHRLVAEDRSRQKRSGTEAVLRHRYRCPAEHCRACPLQARCTPAPASGRAVMRSEYDGEIAALRARMATAEAKQLYRLRGQTVERVNADWKQHRRLRRFRGRGLARVRCEVGLIVLGQNLLALLAEEKKAQGTPADAANPLGTFT